MREERRARKRRDETGEREEIRLSPLKGKPRVGQKHRLVRNSLPQTRNKHVSLLQRLELAGDPHGNFLPSADSHQPHWDVLVFPLWV